MESQRLLVYASTLMGGLWSVAFVLFFFFFFVRLALFNEATDSILLQTVFFFVLCFCPEWLQVVAVTLHAEQPPLTMNLNSQ